MKRIVESCSKNSDGSFLKDAVKLRLRGKGSGFKEGPMNKGIYYFLFYNLLIFQNLMNLCIYVLVLNILINIE